MNPGTRENLKGRILQLLRSPKYQPLDKVEISKKLNFPSERRTELRAALTEMEGAGLIARIRKDCYVIPEKADLVTGILHVRQRGSGYLVSEKPGQAELFIAAENTWTGMDGDRVVARIVNEGLQQPRAAAAGRMQQEGKVIRILKRANETVVGTLQKSNNFFYVIPDSPRLVHNIYVQPTQFVPKPPALGDKVVVKLDPWESRHVNPEGQIIEVLGPAGSPGVDILSIIRKYNLPREFPSAVQSEAERIRETIDEEEIARREDLRGQMIITVDPDDAKDFDDAIHVERTPTGWSAGIHIADVSHYVRPGTQLDREAWQRGNSVYLVDRVIPMLPETLSNGICSLKPHVARLTHSIFIEFTKAGAVKSARFAFTVIRSAARLTYKEAFVLLKKPPESPVGERLHTAWELASLLRRRRFEAGSLDLDFPEIKVWLDEEKRPVRMEKIENDISHQLIEELMLAANEVSARELKNRLIPAVYRIHEDPDPAKLAEYRELAVSYGYKVGDLTHRPEVQRFLQAIRGKPEEHALKIGFLRSLKRATYDVQPRGHYGLAKTNYTHFTSPIRRYADLVVHRAVSALFSPRANGARDVRSQTGFSTLGATAEHISLTERNAADAEKESVKMKKMEYFQNQLKSKAPDVFKAGIVDVRSYGLVIELPDVLLTGLIHVSSLVDDFYLFDPVRLRFTGQRNRREFKIGDMLDVLVARVDMYKQQIDFQLAGQVAAKSHSNSQSRTGPRARGSQRPRAGRR